MVHIDLGIAFEQGRFLNTPELVPFRLTRDIVDGMGAAGARLIITCLCTMLKWRVLPPLPLRLSLMRLSEGEDRDFKEWRKHKK